MQRKTKVAGLVLSVFLALPLLGLLWTMYSEISEGRNEVIPVTHLRGVDQGKVTDLYCFEKDAEQDVRFGVADSCASNVDDDSRRNGIGVNVTRVQRGLLVTGYEL